MELLELLDTGPEPIFDALTRAASQICDAPVALLSLMDSDRLWFKSNLGLDGVTELSSEHSFCTQAILQTDVFEVADASQDKRFRHSQLVAGPTQIRFYAGAPVVMSGGHNVGTLCVLDRKPNTLTSSQRGTLFNLAIVAAQALEMRKKALDLNRFNTALLEQAQALNAKEVLYQAIVEDQTDLISLALPSGELTFVNAAYAAHFGKPAKEMVGHNLLEYVAPSDMESVQAHLRILCTTPAVATGENQMRSAGGESRWIAWSNRSIGDIQGRVVGLHSVGRDITERKRMELALLDSHERYRALYESTPAMMHSIDRQGRLLFVSDKWLHTLGYSREEVIGRSSTDFFTATSSAYAQQEIIPEFFMSGRCEDVPYQMVCKDGRIVDVLLSAVLDAGNDQRQARSLAILENVTERNSMAKSLRVKEERLELATKVNQIGIWELELETGRLEWNDTMFQIFGKDPSTFQYGLSDWSQTVHPDDLERTELAFQESIKTLAPLDIDFRVVKGNGDIRYVNARAVIINDDDGKPSRAMGTNHDVTERKAVEQALANGALQLRTIANNLPVLISRMDSDYRYTFANDNYESWYSFKESIVGKTVSEVFGPDIFKRVQPHIDAAMKGESVSFELLSEIPASPRHLLVHYVPDCDLDGNINGVFGMVQDRTEQHLARQKLEDSERQMRAITDGLPVLIAYVDMEERIQFLNATFKIWANVDPRWAKGQELRDVIGDTLYLQRRPYLQRALSGERVEFSVESEFFGDLKFLQSVYIPDIHANGEVRGIFAISTDITPLKNAEVELQRLVLLDSLTGLPNRRYFDQKLAEAMARHIRTGHLMALMFLDVDYFKSINDTYGHGAGDAVLIEFAKRLKMVVRSTDFAARLAGDEFVILLEDLSESRESEMVAEKLLESIRQPLSFEGQTIDVSCSIGIALHQKISITSDMLIGRADKALYQAKADGRNGYAINYEMSIA